MQHKPFKKLNIFDTPVSFRKASASGNRFILLKHEHVRQGGSSCALSSERVQGLVAHEGLDADQILFLEPMPPSQPSSQPSQGVIYHLSIYNRDGSQANMCANGLRAAAHWLLQTESEGICAANRGQFLLKTASGLYVTSSQQDDAHIFLPIPSSASSVERLEYKSTRLEGGIFLDVGIPHVVFFVENVDHFDSAHTNALCQKSSLFPEGVNLSLVQRAQGSHDSSEQQALKVRVWERGAGPTGSCGTAAGAISWASHLMHPQKREFSIQFPGGFLYTNIVEHPHTPRELLSIKLSGAIQVENEGVMQ